eukprot:Polyplicarium_translucidae@DN2432_c0_g1_i2.p2
MNRDVFVSSRSLACGSPQCMRCRRTWTQMESCRAMWLYHTVLGTVERAGNDIFLLLVVFVEKPAATGSRHWRRSRSSGWNARAASVPTAEPRRIPMYSALI